MLKMIFHDTQGLCLVAKRLDHGGFAWLDAKGAAQIEVDGTELARLLSTAKEGGLRKAS
jgi:hypothetical protein